MSKVYINGRFVDAQRATISIFDRGYLHGEGVFETLRAYDGEPAFVDLHYGRLHDSCRRLGIRLPLTRHALEAVLHQLLKKNRAREAALRITVSALGTASPQRPKNAPTNLVVHLRPLLAKPKTLYQKGASVILVQSVMADSAAIANIKSTNYLSKILAREEVANAKADEGLICTAQKQIVEGTATNLFVVRNGRVLTPPITEGLLPGVTRRVIMGVAEQLQIPIRETSITVPALKSADEIFLTGSITEVLPIREVRGITKKRPCPGPITKQLMDAYRVLIAYKA
jgi:D-amino acid aminotransferase